MQGRILDLKACQILELREYVLSIRPRMLKNVDAQRPGRKVYKVDTKLDKRLFFSESGSHGLKDSLYHLFRGIQKQNKKVTSGKVIRASVLAEWLKGEDVRMVQYKAGHRYVSSTEKYDRGNLHGLRESIARYHPLT